MEKIHKVYRIVGLIGKTFLNLEPEVFKPLYTALVRPHLEYVNQVWNLHLVKDIEAVENVQCRATRMVSQLKVLERLRKTKFLTLSYGGFRGEQIETFKIVKGKYDLDCTEGLFQMRIRYIKRGNSLTP